MIYLYISRTKSFIFDNIYYHQRIFWNEEYGKHEFTNNGINTIICCIPKEYPKNLKLLYTDEIKKLLVNNKYNINIIVSDDLKLFINKLIKEIESTDFDENKQKIKLLESQNKLLLSQLKSNIDYLSSLDNNITLLLINLLQEIKKIQPDLESYQDNNEFLQSLKKLQSELESSSNNNDLLKKYLKEFSKISSQTESNKSIE